MWHVHTHIGTQLERNGPLVPTFYFGSNAVILSCDLVLGFDIHIH